MLFSASAFVITITLTNIKLTNAFEDTVDSNQCGVEETDPAAPSNPPDSQPSEPENLEDNFNKGNSQFTANFFYNVVQENVDKSVTISPYSTLFLLAELALFATGVTLQQLLKALNLQSQDEIKTEIPKVLDSIAEQENITLNLAERVYGNIRSNFSDSFKQTTKDIFKADAQNIDFSNSQAAADIINKWVADNTNNKIKNLIPASVLTPDTEIVLVDAFYFFGVWRYKFDTVNTSPKTFYAPDNKTVIVDMMNQVTFFKYANSDDLNSQVIELPYVNGNLTFLIFLPNDNNGVTNLVTKLLDPNAFTSVRNSLQSTKIDLSLPKFNTTTTVDLKDILRKLNISEIFDPNTSGLSGILATPQKLYVTAGIQKVNIDVNESGSEAAAGNAIIGTRATAAAPIPPILFNANHPFVYYLLFQGTPIFCGLFAGK